MTRQGLILHHGGLYRCCLESAINWVRRSPHAAVTDGETIDCEAEGKPTMRVDLSLDGGAICWNGGDGLKGPMQ
jgi:hypothetical protein